MKKLVGESITFRFFTTVGAIMVFAAGFFIADMIFGPFKSYFVLWASALVSLVYITFFEKR